MSASAIPAFCAYGVELEYMIVSDATLDVAPLAGPALKALAGNSREPGPPPSDVIEGPLGWSNELVCHLLELKNPRPVTGFDGLANEMQGRVGHMNRVLRPLGARLMPGGMHPWMRPARETMLWPYANAAIYAAYDRIFGCRSHGWANLQSQHLNLPFASDDEFARLHAAVRVLLPILPAVAASSPFIEGAAACALDARLGAYSNHAVAVPSLTGDLIPDTAVSRAQYLRDVLEPIYRDVARVDPEGTLQFEWINARGAIPRFDRNALEVRVLDVQECPVADLGIAALVADAARYLYEERPSALRNQQDLSTAALRAMLADCARYADETVISDIAYLRVLGVDGERCDAATLWADLASRMVQAGMPNVAHWQEPLEHILRRGSLAKRLLDAAGSAPSHEELVNVYRELCSCLDEGRMFGV